ncbi:heparin lyase I family protein [Actinomycetospora endophytica]|uniref:Heparin lyase I family protein n=1 Tax=Actinomycetospora endophytica TaxID=2291215 RepID=A0ABS8P6H8_9PSEU|nr:heparin lyase I family protein [Actinomycetospora endophytica]MCD2193857.1 heparin lyase I family protein [Actinomycetospora endophytica]
MRGKHRHDPATTPLDLAAIARAAAEVRADGGGSATGDTGGLLDTRAQPSPATGAHRAPAGPVTGGVPASPPGPPPGPMTGGFPGSPPGPATGGFPGSPPGPATGGFPGSPTGPVTGGFPGQAPMPARPGHAPAPSRPVTAGFPGPGRASHRAPREHRVMTPGRAAGALALFGALTGASVAAASTGPSFLADPAADTGELARPNLAVAPAGVSEPVVRTPSPAPHTAPSTGRTTTAAPTTTTSAPAPSLLGDGGKTLWSADFASAGMKNFKSTPWNNQGASTPSVAGGLLNVLMPGGGKRSEVEPDFKALQEGDQYYFGFSVKLAPDFPVNTSDWQVITQFKNDGDGSPPLELKVQNGKFLIDGDSGGFSKVVGDAKPGQWTHLVLKVKFSSSNGTVSAWQDGQQKIADFAPPSGTMYSGKDSYVKTGIYRDTSIGQAGKLAFGSWAIGTSLGSVSKDLPAGLD